MRIVASAITFVMASLAAHAQSKPPQVKPFKGAEGAYLCAALSADGKRLVTGGRDGSIVLWDAESRRELQSFAGHKGNVLGVAFEPKGEFVVSVGVDKTVRVRTLDGKDKVPPIGPAKDVPTCVAVSPDGKRIIYAGWDGMIHQIGVEKSESIGDKAADQGPIFSLAFSPDGKWLASGGRKGTVQIWEATNELKLHATLPDHGKTVWAVAWSSDSASLAASAGNAIRIWNVAEKKPVGELKGHLAPVLALAFSDSGKKLISGSDDRTVRIWDIATKKAETLATANGPVVGVAASPNGKSVYTVSDETVQSARVFLFGKE